MHKRADLYSRLQYAVSQAEDIWVNQILWLPDTLPTWTIFKELKYNEIQFMKKQSNHGLVDNSEAFGEPTEPQGYNYES